MSIQPLNHEKNTLVSNDQPIALTFGPLESTSSFFPLVKEALEKAQMGSSLSESKNTFEVLLANGNPTCCFAYRNLTKPYRTQDSLVSYDSPNNLFIVELIHSLQTNTEYFEKTVNRIIQLARRSFAEEIQIKNIKLLPEAETEILKSKNFTVNGLEEKSFSLFLSSNKSNMENKNINKRKRDYSSRVIDEKEVPNKRKKLNQELEGKNYQSVTTQSKESVMNQKQEQTYQARSELAQTHHLPMKGTIYFDYIMEGKKLYEGRVNGPSCHRMKVGDNLKLYDRQARWGIICKITSKDSYPSFENMLRSKGILNMLPQLTEKAAKLSEHELLQEGVKIYRSFPGSYRVQQAGAVAIGVKFIKKISGV